MHWCVCVCVCRCALQSSQGSVCWCGPSVSGASPPVIQVTPLEHWASLLGVYSGSCLRPWRRMHHVICFLGTCLMAKEWRLAPTRTRHAPHPTTGSRITRQEAESLDNQRHWDWDPSLLEEHLSLFSGSRLCFSFSLWGINEWDWCFSRVISSDHVRFLRSYSHAVDARHNRAGLVSGETLVALVFSSVFCFTESHI